MVEREGLSLVIPVYNEEANVEALFHELVSVLSNDHLDYEIIFVDDGSTDGTLSRLRSLAQSSSRLRVFWHKYNAGQSAALYTGIKAASCHLIVTLDGDGQNDPADVATLLACYDGGTKVILGNREKRDDNGLRRLSSTVGNAIRRAVLRDDCPDTGCSLKLFPRAAFLALPHFNHMHRFLPALFKRAGYELINIPVNHRARRHGLSKYGVMNRLFVGIHDLIGVRWLLKRPCEVEVSSDE